MFVKRRKSKWTGKWVWDVYQGKIIISPHFHSKSEAVMWMNNHETRRIV